MSEIGRVAWLSCVGRDVDVWTIMATEMEVAGCCWTKLISFAVAVVMISLELAMSCALWRRRGFIRSSKFKRRCEKVSRVILVICGNWRNRVKDKLRQYQQIRVVDTTGSKLQPKASCYLLR